MRKSAPVKRDSGSALTASSTRWLHTTAGWMQRGFFQGLACRPRSATRQLYPPMCLDLSSRSLELCLDKAQPLRLSFNASALWTCILTPLDWCSGNDSPILVRRQRQREGAPFFVFAFEADLSS